MMKVFEPEFPLTAEFRSGPRGYKKSYDDWLDQQLMPNGRPVDLQTNVLRFEPQNYAYANKFARDHPETMVLSTWRAASGTPKDSDDDGDPLGKSVIDFPGHWVLSPGTTLSSNISPTSQTLSVASTNNMRKGPALLVETTASGEKLWGRFEYVLITSVDTSSIAVRREFNGSPAARAFPSGRTYIAPMPWDSRNRKPYTDWFFNFSRYCPKDSRGRTAMDVIASHMIDPLRNGGPLDQISGLDLASGPLTMNPSEADYDLDGFVDPESVYRDGVRTFYQRVRDTLGPERVLTTQLDYEYLDYINGVNQEGLGRPDDPWEEVTDTVNEVFAWKKLSKLPMVSLAFQQHMNREEDLLRVNLVRLLNGYSSCLGLAADIETGSGSEALDKLKQIELYKGDEERPHWLGKQLALKRAALMTPNLLNNARSQRDWERILPALTIKRGTLQIDGDELVLAPQEKDFPGYVTLDLDFPLATKGDFTVYMEAISDDDQIERRILLPRVNVDVESKPLRAKLTNIDYLPMTFYIRGADRGNVNIDFRFDTGGPVRFRSLSVHAATDAMACEYENGVVIVNPSLEDQEYDLTQLFPGRSGFRRIYATAPNGEIPDKYKPQLWQALRQNNGQSVSRNVVVTERNAIFLSADSIRSRGSLQVNGFQLLPQGDNTGVPAPVPMPRPRPNPTATLTATPTATPTRRLPPSKQWQRPMDQPMDTDITLDSNDTPNMLRYVGNGDDLPLLDLCEGDCDRDKDCRDNLVCYKRNKKSSPFVVGCLGRAEKKKTDFCVDPVILSANKIVQTNEIYNIFEDEASNQIVDVDDDDFDDNDDDAAIAHVIKESESGPSMGWTKLAIKISIAIVSAALAVALLVFHRRKNTNDNANDPSDKPMLQKGFTMSDSLSDCTPEAMEIIDHGIIGVGDEMSTASRLAYEV